MKKLKCVMCEKTGLTKNEIGISKKLIGGENSLYCIECLAGYLGVTEQDIYDKIEEFKENGCTMFD